MSGDYCLFTKDLPDNKNFMPSVGNGYIGTVIMSDVLHVSGIYNGKANVKPVHLFTIKNLKYGFKGGIRKQRSWESNHTHRAHLPSPLAVNFTLNVKGSRSYALDLKHGVFYQWFDNSVVHIEQKIYTHRNHKNLMVNEITVNTSVPLKIKLYQNYKESNDFDFKHFDTKQTNSKGVIGITKETETEHLSRQSACIVWTKVPDTIDIDKSSETQTFRYLAIVTTNLTTKDPEAIATKFWIIATLSQEDLFNDHKNAWENLWNKASIDIEGNTYISQTVHASMYYILSSASKNDGISPGGLARSSEYLGHVFWDQESWIIPPLNIMYPGIAENLLKYRYERLTSASEIAHKYGYKGNALIWIFQNILKRIIVFSNVNILMFKVVAIFTKHSILDV